MAVDKRYSTSGRDDLWLATRMSGKQKKNHEFLRKANVRRCRLCAWPNYQGLGFHLTRCSPPPQMISLVESNSPAAAGGLKISDALLRINTTTVSDLDYEEVLCILKAAIDSNDRIELLVVERKYLQKIVKYNLVIKSRFIQDIDTPVAIPGDYLDASKRILRTCHIHRPSTEADFGFELVSGPHCIGAYIQEVLPNSPASHAGLRKSDRILQIDDRFVDNLDTKIIFARLEEVPTRRTVKLLVADTQTYALGLSNQASLYSLVSLASPAIVSLDFPPDAPVHVEEVITHEPIPISHALPTRRKLSIAHQASFDYEPGSRNSTSAWEKHGYEEVDSAPPLPARPATFKKQSQSYLEKKVCIHSKNHLFTRQFRTGRVWARWRRPRSIRRDRR